MRGRREFAHFTSSSFSMPDRVTDYTTHRTSSTGTDTVAHGRYNCASTSLNQAHLDLGFLLRCDDTPTSTLPVVGGLLMSIESLRLSLHSRDHQMDLSYRAKRTEVIEASPADARGDPSIQNEKRWWWYLPWVIPSLAKLFAGLVEWLAALWTAHKP